MKCAYSYPLIFSVLVALVCSVKPNSEGSEPSPEPYAFNYASETEDGSISTRSESGNRNGEITGFYTITDADGRTRRVDYVADASGFRAKVTTNEEGTTNHKPADAEVSSSYINGAKFLKKQTSRFGTTPHRSGHSFSSGITSTSTSHSTDGSHTGTSRRSRNGYGARGNLVTVTRTGSRYGTRDEEGSITETATGSGTGSGALGSVTENSRYDSSYSLTSNRAKESVIGTGNTRGSGGQGNLVTVTRKTETRYGTGSEEDSIPETGTGSGARGSLVTVSRTETTYGSGNKESSNTGTDTGSSGVEGSKLTETSRYDSSYSFTGNRAKESVTERGSRYGSAGRGNLVTVARTRYDTGSEEGSITETDTGSGTGSGVLGSVRETGNTRGSGARGSLVTVSRTETTYGSRNEESSNTGTDTGSSGVEGSVTGGSRYGSSGRGNLVTVTRTTETRYGTGSEEGSIIKTDTGSGTGSGSGALGSVTENSRYDSSYSDIGNKAKESITETGNTRGSGGRGSLVTVTRTETTFGSGNEESSNTGTDTGLSGVEGSKLTETSRYDSSYSITGNTRHLNKQPLRFIGPIRYGIPASHSIIETGSPGSRIRSGVTTHNVDENSNIRGSRYGSAGNLVTVTRTTETRYGTGGEEGSITDTGTGSGTGSGALGSVTENSRYDSSYSITGNRAKESVTGTGNTRGSRYGSTGNLVTVTRTETRYQSGGDGLDYKSIPSSGSDDKSDLDFESKPRDLGHILSLAPNPIRGDLYAGNSTEIGKEKSTSHGIPDTDKSKSAYNSQSGRVFKLTQTRYNSGSGKNLHTDSLTRDSQSGVTRKVESVTHRLHNINKENNNDNESIDKNNDSRIGSRSYVHRTYTVSRDGNRFQLPTSLHTDNSRKNSENQSTFYKKVVTTTYGGKEGSGVNNEKSYHEGKAGLNKNVNIGTTRYISEYHTYENTGDKKNLEGNRDSTDESDQNGNVEVGKNYNYQYHYSWSSDESKPGSVSLIKKQNTRSQSDNVRFLGTRNYTTSIDSSNHGSRNNNIVTKKYVQTYSRSYEDEGDEAIPLEGSLDSGDLTRGIGSTYIFKKKSNDISENKTSSKRYHYSNAPKRFANIRYILVNSTKINADDESYQSLYSGKMNLTTNGIKYVLVPVDDSVNVEGALILHPEEVEKLFGYKILNG